MDLLTNIFAAVSSTSSANWFSLALVVITAIYVFLTWNILKSNNNIIQIMREQFQETIRPYVTVNLALSQRGLFVLEITNRGRFPASNLKLNIDRDFYLNGNDTEESNIRNLNAFKETTSTFSPGEKLVISLFTSFEMDRYADEAKNLTPKKFTITVEYQFLNDQYEDSFTIDAGQYEMTAIVKSERDLLQGITNHLQEIEKHLKKIAG